MTILESIIFGVPLETVRDTLMADIYLLDSEDNKTYVSGEIDWDFFRIYSSPGSVSFR